MPISANVAGCFPVGRGVCPARLVFGTASPGVLALAGFAVEGAFAVFGGAKREEVLVSVERWGIRRKCRNGRPKSRIAK